MRFRNVYEISHTFQPNMTQIKHQELYNWLVEQGYTHIQVDDDDRFTAINPEGKVENLMYVFMRRVPYIKPL